MDASIREMVECPVCLSIYSDPRQLLCGHSVCAATCGPQLVVNGAVRCPLCRQQTRLPPGGVGELQKSHLVSELIGLTRRVAPSGELHSSCSSCYKTTEQLTECHTVSKKQNLLSACGHCQLTLCTTCATRHRKYLVAELRQLTHNTATEANCSISSLPKQLPLPDDVTRTAEASKQNIKIWVDALMGSLQLRKHHLKGRIASLSTQQKDVRVLVKARKHDLEQLKTHTARLSKESKGGGVSLGRILAMREELLVTLKKIRHPEKLPDLPSATITKLHTKELLEAIANLGSVSVQEAKPNTADCQVPRNLSQRTQCVVCWRPSSEIVTQTDPLGVAKSTQSDIAELRGNSTQTKWLRVESSTQIDRPKIRVNSSQTEAVASVLPFFMAFSLLFLLCTLHHILVLGVGTPNSFASGWNILCVATLVASGEQIHERFFVDSLMVSIVWDLMLGELASVGWKILVSLEYWISLWVDYVPLQIIPIATTLQWLLSLLQ